MVHLRRFLLAATLLAPVIATPEISAQSASDGRNLFFYFDISTLSKDDQANAISAAEKFVQRQAGANDQLAVMVFGGSKVAVKQDLTSDRERVLHALHHIADNPAENVSQNQIAFLTAGVNIATRLPGKKQLLCFARPAGPAPSEAEMKSVRDRAAESQVGVYVIPIGETR